MKSNIVFLLLTFCFFTGMGQTKKLNSSKKIDISVYVWKLYDSIKANGASSIISVQRSFFGMHILDSLGGPDIYIDILWKIKDTTYFQEIKYYTDRIIRNPPKVITKSDVFTILTNYYDTIKTEDILPFITKSQINSIETYTPLTPIHKANYDILFFQKNEMFQKSFEDSYLQESLTIEHLNLNYRYNNSTKLMMLWKKIWEIIKNN